MNVREAALEYARRGLLVVPIPDRQKAPTLDGWQQLRLTAETIPDYFNGDNQNIGVLLGEPYNLADVDVDSREALWTWPEFAPDTGWVHGRQSKPQSHYFYYSDPAARTAKYLDPCAKSDVQACLIELRSLTQAGKPGLQTVVPPSIHPSGQRIEFAILGNRLPGNVDRDPLERAVRRTAGISLLGRYAPGEGARHDFFLAVSGALARSKWTLEDAMRALRALYKILWGTRANLASAERDADSTYQKFDDGGEVTGFAHLREIVDERVLGKAAQWLGLEKVRPQPQPQPKKTQQLVVESLDDLLSRRDPANEQLIEDLLPRAGATLLYGAQKSGKTLLAVQAALGVSTGSPLFQNFTVRAPGGVLVWEQDDPAGRASVREILEKTHTPAGAPFYFVAKQDFSIGLEMIAQLERAIRERSLSLVILDSYTALRSPHPAGVDIVKHENQEMTMLDELGKRTQCCILLIHHASKGASALDWASHAGGTYAMTMAVESQIHITRYPELSIDASERLVRLQGRHLRSREMTLRFSVEVMSYELVVDGAAASLYPMILEIQSAFGSAAFNAKLLAEATGVSRPTAFRHLSALRRSDAVVKTSTGDYLLNSQFWRRP